MNTPRTILVVDDNEANVALLEYLLIANGYDVRSTGDAESALASIARRIDRRHSHHRHLGFRHAG